MLPEGSAKSCDRQIHRLAPYGAVAQEYGTEDGEVVKNNGRWQVGQMGSQHYLAERKVNGIIEWHEVSAHCLACAKNEILMEYGGKVDLRGWQKQGNCGFFLRVTASELEEPPESYFAEEE